LSFQKIQSPENVPSADIADYQKQNAILSASYLGLDTSCLSIIEGKVILKANGIIEYNGVLYKILTDIDLTNDINNIFLTNDFCCLAFNGDSISAVSDKGTLLQSKNARYLSSGKRLLNVMLRYSDDFTKWDKRLLYTSIQTPL
jgi:hypothetical protein